MMNLNDIARRLGHNKSTVSAWVKRGYINAQIEQQGNRVRYHVSERDVIDFLTGPNGAVACHDKIDNPKWKQLHAEAHGIPDGYEISAEVARKFHLVADSVLYRINQGDVHSIAAGPYRYVSIADMEAIYGPLSQ